MVEEICHWAESVVPKRREGRTPRLNGRQDARRYPGGRPQDR